MDFAERKQKVEHLLRVKYPFSWAPPPLNALRPGGYGAGNDGVDSKALHERNMQMIEAERQRLMALPDGEFEAAFATAKTVEDSKVHLEAQIAEKGRFFSHPPAEADFVYWSKVEYWSLDESIALLLGKSPEVVNWKSIQPLTGVSAFAKQYERLRNLALRATRINRGIGGLNPAAVVTWAIDMDITVPVGLSRAFEARRAKREVPPATAHGEARSLLLRIAGREALPIRAIPYVTGWGLSPDEVAKHFAKAMGKPFGRLENTSAHILAGDQQRQVLPKEWDLYVAALDGLEAELKAKHSNEKLGYSEWVKLSVTRLPAGAFVWRDEFEADFARNFSPAALSSGSVSEREGERELTYSPMLEAGLREMVMEGFAVGAATLDEVVQAPQTDRDASTTPAQAHTVGETPVERQNRRLARVRALGDDLKLIDGDTWQMAKRTGALAALEREERAAQRPMSDKTNIRNDLAAAAEREREGKRAGTG